VIGDPSNIEPQSATISNDSPYARIPRPGKRSSCRVCIHSWFTIVTMAWHGAVSDTVMSFGPG